MFRAWVELNSFCSTPVATPHGCVTDGYVRLGKDFSGVLSEAIDWWTFHLEDIVRHWFHNSEYEQKLKRTKKTLRN